MIKRHMVPVFVGAVLLVAGCSSSPSTQAPGGSSGTSATPSASSAAPKVADPLPASVFDKHPCDSALTDEQLRQLISDAPPSYHTDNAAGPGCGWTRKATGTIIQVAWMTGVRGGLSEQPTEGCNLAVGIADNLVFDADVDASGGKVSRRDGAAQIAQKVLANLKAAAGK